MPRKRRSTKSRIVKAAWNLFYKNGYEQTTVEDIINASKTSKGTFYHYFKGKEALLNSLSYLFDQKYEDLAAVIDPNLSCYDKLASIYICWPTSTLRSWLPKIRNLCLTKNVFISNG